MKGERATTDPLYLDAKKAIEWVSARFRRAGMPFERAELENEAWRACLASWHLFDPAKGNAVGYFRRIARRAAAKFCNKSLAKVSMGKNHANGAQYQSGVEVQDWIHGEMDARFAEGVQDKLGDGPERQLLAKEWDRKQACFVKRIRDAVEGLLEAWDPYDSFLVRRLTGLDGYRPERPRELAARINGDIRRIYKAHARLEKEMWGHTELVLLHLNGGEEDR